MANWFIMPAPFDTQLDLKDPADELRRIRGWGVRISSVTFPDHVELYVQDPNDVLDDSNKPDMKSARMALKRRRALGVRVKAFSDYIDQKRRERTRK